MIQNKQDNGLPIRINVSESFLHEEIRCDYLVSSKMKEIWAIEIDLLNEFDRICKKHNIKYMACGGTILGAVRHKGFIPWDDDIDLMMDRDNYNKICSVGKEFEEPYFFQIEDTDAGTLRGHAQLRNSLTTAILKSEYDQKHRFNQGIFIDIFPLDNLPDSEQERRQFIKKCQKEKKISRQFKYGIHYRRNIFAFAMELYNLYILNKRGENSQSIYKQFEKSAQKYNDINTKSCTLVCSDTINHIYEYDNADLSELIYVPFEDFTIPIPKNFDHVLTSIYGNWKEFVVGKNDHGDVIFDTQKKYSDYFETAPKDKMYIPRFLN